jgi:hypothetical protein
MDTLPEGPMLDLVLASLDVEGLASLYFTNNTLRELVERYLEIRAKANGGAQTKSNTANDYALPGANEVLLNSAIKGKTRVVQFILRNGVHDCHRQQQANADVYNKALRMASRIGHTDIVRLLLQAGADVHARKDMALRAASEYGRKDIVRVLLQAGAKMQTYDNPLVLASRYGHTEVVRLLLDAGTDCRVLES